MSILMDTLEARAGTTTPLELLELIPLCRQRVVVGTPGAIASPEVAKEIARFGRNDRRSTIVIGFERPVFEAPWYREHLPGMTPIKATSRNAPGKSELDIIVGGFRYKRQRWRTMVGSAIAVILIVIAAIGTIWGFRMLSKSQRELARVRIQTDLERKKANKAASEAQTANDLARARTETDSLGRLHRAQGFITTDQLSRALHASDTLAGHGFEAEADALLIESIQEMPQHVIELPARKEAIEGFTDDGQTLLVLRDDRRTMAKIDVQTGKTVLPLFQHPGQIISVAMDPKRTHMVVGTDLNGAQSLYLWDLNLAVPPRIWNCAGSASASFIGDGSALEIDCGGSKRFDIVNRQGNKPAAITYMEGPDRLTTLSVQTKVTQTREISVCGPWRVGQNNILRPDGLAMLSYSSSDRVVTICIPGESAAKDRAVQFIHEGVRDANFTPDSKYILTQSESDISVWDAESAALLGTAQLAATGHVAFSSDSRYAVLPGREGTWVLHLPQSVVTCAVPKPTSAAWISTSGRYLVIPTGPDIMESQEIGTFECEPYQWRASLRSAEDGPRPSLAIVKAAFAKAGQRLLVTTAETLTGSQFPTRYRWMLWDVPGRRLLAMQRYQSDTGFDGVHSEIDAEGESILTANYMSKGTQIWLWPQNHDPSVPSSVSPERVLRFSHTLHAGWVAAQSLRPPASNLPAPLFDGAQSDSMANPVIRDEVLSRFVPTPCNGDTVILPGGVRRCVHRDVDYAEVLSLGPFWETKLLLRTANALDCSPRPNSDWTLLVESCRQSTNLWSVNFGSMLASQSHPPATFSFPLVDEISGIFGSASTDMLSLSKWRLEDNREAVRRLIQANTPFLP